MSISSAAIVMSTIALSEAEQAKTMACKFTVSNYDAKTATVVQMREYSECVSRLHPQEISPDIIISLKIIFILCIIGGIIFTLKSGYNGIVDVCMEFMFGAIITLVCGGSIVCVIAGCIWVVS